MAERRSKRISIVVVCQSKLPYLFSGGDRLELGRIFKTVGKDDNVARKVRQKGKKADGENECEPKSRRKVEQAFLQTETEKRYKREIKRSKPDKQLGKQRNHPQMTSST